jgi:hypothetical protein
MKADRFSYLKKKKSFSTPEEFASALKKNERKTKKLKEKLLLSISGKMKRTEDCSHSYQIFLRNDIKNDIDRYCLGSMQGIVNYLIRRGLDEIIAKGEPIIEELD